LSESIVQELRAKDASTMISVVAPDNITSAPPTALLERFSPQPLAPLLARARGAIIGGGVTALEAAYLGTPTVILPIANNQRPGAGALAGAGAAICVKSAPQAGDKMIQLIENPSALEQMSLKARRLVDGQGPARLATLMSSL
jgi:UDP-2,4-diacetamido-2,4,6-trideoxy-beta-L-altropyranose hydrolase